MALSESPLNKSALMSINYYLEIYKAKPETLGVPKNGSHKLDVYEFTGTEHVNDGFLYNVSIVSLKHIHIEDLLNLEAELFLEVNKEHRFIKGHISGVKSQAKIGKYFIYEIKLTSWLEYLKHVKYSRIYQDLTSKEIIQKAVSEISGTLGMDFQIKFSLSTSKTKHYLKREYCVQYNETVYNFIFRLLEEEGMFIKIDKNVVTVIDHNPTGNTIIQAFVNEEVSIFSSNINYNSYDYEHANHSFKANKKGMTYNKLEGIYTVDKAGIHNKLPTDVFIDRLDMEKGKEDKSMTDSIQQKADLDTNRHIVPAKTMKGTSKNLNSHASLTCLIQDHSKGAVPFIQKSMIISSKYVGKKPNTLHEYASDDIQGTFTSEFTFIDDTIFYRPPLTRHKNRINSKQIAVIGGLGTEEKYVDHMGRVKVQFFWNNKLTDKEDENSLSCWVRLSHIWNGDQNGAMFIPSVGQEVLVTFVNGDPDYPIVDGMLYNSKNQAKNDWQSTINQWSITTKSSGQQKSNDKFSQIMFDSTKDNEKVYLKSEKDFTSFIKNDEDKTVVKNQTITIGEDQTVEVDSNQLTTVGGSQNIAINQNYSMAVEHTFEHKSENSTEQVNKNKMLLVGENLQTEVIKNNSLTVTGEHTNWFQNLYTSTFQLHSTDYYEASKATYITTDNHMKIMGSSIKELEKDSFVTTKGTFKIKAEDNIQIESSSGISLNVGGNFLTITKDDISIKGKKVRINSGGSIIKVKDPEVKEIEKTTHDSLRVTSLKIEDGQYKHGRTRLKCKITVERWQNKDEGWKAITSLTEAEKDSIKYEALYMNTEGNMPEMIVSFVSKDGFNFLVPPIKDKIYKNLKLFAYVKTIKEATTSLELNRDLRIKDLTKSSGNQYTATTNLKDLRKKGEKTIPMREELFILWQTVTASDKVEKISTIIEKPPEGKSPVSKGIIWKHKADEPTQVVAYERKYGSYVALASDGTKESREKRPRRSKSKELPTAKKSKELPTAKKSKFGWEPTLDFDKDGISIGGEFKLGPLKISVKINLKEIGPACKHAMKICKKLQHPKKMLDKFTHPKKALDKLADKIQHGPETISRHITDTLGFTKPDNIDSEKGKNKLIYQIEVAIKKSGYVWTKPDKDGNMQLISRVEITETKTEIITTYEPTKE